MISDNLRPVSNCLVGTFLIPKVVINTSPVLNSKNCPVTHAVRLMGRRWKPLVLYYLKPGPLRFSELRRCLPEATQKMLTQTLRELEKDGLILRKAYPQVPPKVVYSVTRYGRTLEPILLALCAWGKKDFKRRRA